MTLLLRGMPARVAGLTSQAADSAHRLIGGTHFRLVSANPAAPACQAYANL